MACGLEFTGSGLAVDEAGTSPVDVIDGGPDADGNLVEADGPAPPAEGGDPCAPCGFATPSGWSLVAYGIGSPTCPAPASPDDAIENADAGPGACACDAGACAITTTPTCTSGAISTLFDSTGAAKCDQSGTPLDASNGLCAPLAATLGKHTEIVAPAPVGGGTCSLVATPDKHGVSSTHARICRAATCSSVCTGLPSALSACIAQAGDVACPSGFSARHTLGSDVAVTCGSCGACSVTASGCSGTMTFYSDGMCANDAVTLVAGACTVANGAAIGSYKWTGTPTGLACHTSAASAPSITLVGTTTVCCK
jgi:hypothetical protein